MANRFPKEKFEQLSAENGYEVFTPDQIASYYKEGIQKSMSNEMSEAEKKEFVADCMYLSKAVLVDKDGAESTVYFRKSQIDWERAEDGTIMKGVAGVYADTPNNRLLGRVGEAYIPDEEFMKSLDNDADNAIAKAMRTGRYADTPENRRLHRVGQPYKKRASKGDDDENGGGRKPASEKEGGEYSKEVQSLVNEYSKALKGFKVSSVKSEKGEDGNPMEAIHATGNLNGHKVSFTLYTGNNAHFLESVDGDDDIDSDFENFESLSELKEQVGYVVEGHEDDDED